MFKEIKTPELTGTALDWAVAKCEYDNRRYNYGSPCFDIKTKRVYETEGLKQIGVTFAPSADWKQGGPIIEREKIGVAPECLPCSGWVADTKIINERTHRHGPTPLIAAMRCYVASKLGDTVSVPVELL
jgi:hypothetical protein